MKLVFRPEEPSDYRHVEALTREAFWNHYIPGCYEHYLVHILRDSPCFVKALDYVAEADGRLVGSILYTASAIHKDDGTAMPVMGFGPISVLPEVQGQGIGSQLIEHTKKLAAAMGCKAILIYGDPEYYRRVGFTGAAQYGVATAQNDYADALLACELVPGALAGCAGRFMEHPIFEVDEAEAAMFDQTFPPKAKQSGLPSQRRFETLAVRRRPR